MPKNDSIINITPEEREQKRGLLASIQRVFQAQRSGDILSIKPDIVPFAAAPTPQGENVAPSIEVIDPPTIVTTDELEHPSAPNFKAQWADLPIKSTAQGSLVPSEIEDDLNRIAWYSTDYQERIIVYQNVDDVLANSAEAALAREEYLDGIFNQGCTYRVAQFKKSPDALDDPEAIRMAEMCNELWQDLELKRSLKFKRQALGSRVDYGFTAIETPFDPWGTIVSVDVLPPYGMRINLYRGRFFDDQLEAYIQYDPQNLSNQTAAWPELGIVWSADQRFSWQFYGVSRMMAALADANGLIRGTNLLPDAREAAQTQVFASFKDAAGNPVDPSNLDEFEQTTRKAKKDRGENITANDIMIANGVATLEAIYGDAAFFNTLTDLEKHAAVVCAVYGGNYISKFKPQIQNRSIAEKLEDQQFYRWYNAAKAFTEDVDKPMMERMIAAKNWSFAQQLMRKGLKPRLYIDPNKVVLNAEWNARRNPERLKNEGEFAVETYDIGRSTKYINPKTGEKLARPVISARRVTIILSRVFEFDPTEEETWIEEELAAEAKKESNQLQSPQQNQLPDKSKQQLPPKPQLQLKEKNDSEQVM